MNHTDFLEPRLFSSSSPKRTVRAGRRRPTTTPPDERQQAEAPMRRRPSSGGGTTGGGGLQLPGGLGGRSPLTILLLILVVICGLPLYFLFGGNSQEDETPVEQPPISAELPEEQPTARPTQRPRPTATRLAVEAVVTNSGQTWTVMLYQDADDKILEQDIYIDLNEVERANPNPNVQVVAQVDRFRGGYNGDGNWTGTRRYRIQLDDDLQSVRSELVDDLGEVNMADGDSLIDFATWAVENYPADKYVLILSDHGPCQLL